MAAGADAHFYIEKKTDGKSTQVRLKELGKESITQEIARMLGALSDTDAVALSHAQQMINAARKK